MKCCELNKKNKEDKTEEIKKEQYKCELCESRSYKPKDCCGQPMKKVKYN